MLYKTDRKTSTSQDMAQTDTIRTFSQIYKRFGPFFETQTMLSWLNNVQESDNEANRSQVDAYIPKIRINLKDANNGHL